jgi:ubiquinone/menaquinone biosynthesis C-methylase UbiE
MIRGLTHLLSLKSRERDAKRYEDVYSNLLKEKTLFDGIESVETIYRKPFFKYYSLLKQNVTKDMAVLELGCGSGTHSGLVMQINENFSMLDISESALKICAIKGNGKVKTLLGSIDQIPTSDNFFDLVISCGSFSYVKWSDLQKEVIRVTKPGGSLIFLDSLNHNPIYILNRFMHVLTRKRTLASVIRIPTLKSLTSLSQNYKSSEIFFFDSLIWLRKLGVSNSVIEKKLDILERKFIFRKFSFRVVGVFANLQK